MELKEGTTIWIPCEVKPGPFSNERLARVEHLDGTWVGFVDANYLRNKVATGSDLLQARVVSVKGDHFYARLPGHSVGATPLFHGTLERAVRDPISACLN